MFQPDRLADLVQEDRCARPKTFAPNSIRDLIAWLETQPSDRAYEWYDPAGCLVCAYFLEGCGLKRNPSGSAANVKFSYEAPFQNDNADYHFVGRTLPHTFGGALQRAREYAARVK